MRYFLIIFALLFATGKTVNAQNKSNIKFGKITAADFTVSASVIDSNTNAVVIADIGSTEFEGNNKGWFTLVFKRTVRIKIINQNGLNAATVSIPLYTDNGFYQVTKNSVKLADLKGATYNNNNGAISVTQLDKNSIFDTKINRNWSEKKFTFPGVKAGSIIEYAYTIESDYMFSLHPWYFQGEYPCLWSEYTVRIPDCFGYIYLSKVHIPFFIKESKTETEIFRVEDQFSRGAAYRSSRPESYSINTNIAVDRWVIKDVPGLKKEPMLYTTKNYVPKLEFQLFQFRFSDPPENKMNTWATVNKAFLESADFGKALSESNWLDNDLTTIISSTDNRLDKARKIFAFVRDNFASKGNNGIYLSANTSLRDVYKNKYGSVSDINLLLTAMLKQAGIQADPVILSSRENGLVHPVYPILERYNYVICRVIIDDTVYTLDASNRYLGFNQLPKECFNGLARVISVDTATLYFNPESVKEPSSKTIILTNSESGNHITGNLSYKPGNNESLRIREKLSTHQQEDYFTELFKDSPAEMKAEDYTVDALNNYDLPLNLTCKVDLAFNNEPLIYFNPMLGQALKENPFKSIDARIYPVEMPYCSDAVFILNMEIPKGYKVEEMPKSARIKLDYGGGLFEYLIEERSNRIQFKCELKISKAFFPQDEYNALRELYTYVIKKESEQIVFKKIN